MNWDRVAIESFQHKTKCAAKSIIRFTGATARWRNFCLKRDCYACVLCGSKRDLEVHHIERWIDAPLLRLRKTNGATLCKACHINGHNKTGHEFQPETTARIRRAILGQFVPPRQPSKILIKRYMHITPPEF